MKKNNLRRVWLVVLLVGIYLKELAISSMVLARTAFAWKLTTSPAIVAIPINLRTDLGIAALANLVSLTPGTTALHVSEDRSTLYIHCLDAPSIPQIIRDIKDTFEHRIREIEG